MEVVWGQSAEQHRARAGCVWDQCPRVHRAGCEGFDEVLGSQGGDVAEQDCYGAGAHGPLHVADRLPNCGVQTITLL